MKKIILINIILIINIFNAFNCNSQLNELLKQSWRWRSYDVNDGLPSKNIYDLIVTPKGPIWAVTGKGICYFNDYYWVTVGSEQTFNKPWLRTNNDQNDGLYCIDYFYKMYHITKTKIDSTDFKYNNKHINILDVAAKDSNKIIFTGFFDNDTIVYMFQKTDNNITIIENEKMNCFGKVSTLGKILNMNVLISSNNYGVYLVNDSLLKFIDESSKVIFSDPNLDIIKNSHLFKFGINKLIFLAGRLYPYNGVWEYDIAKSELKSLIKPKKSEFLNIAMNSKGEIIVLDIHQKLIFRNIKGIIEKLSLDFVNSTIYQIKFDNNDNLWIRTDLGLYFINIQSNLWTYINKTSKKFNEINMIAKSKDNEYLLATNDGIQIDSNLIIKQLSSISNIKLNTVTSICKDSSGNIWVVSGASFKGAFKYDGKKWYYYGKNELLPFQNYHKVICDYKGNVWFLPLSFNGLTNLGVYFFDGNKFNEFGKGILSNGKIYDMVFDSTKYVFGSSLGIFISKNGKIKQVENFGNINSWEVFSLAIDLKDRIWFAGRVNTPGYLDSNLKSVYPEVFFKNDVKTVWDLEFDKAGRLWITTRNGLFVYHDGIVTQFDKTNGLSHSLLWPLLIDNDKVFIGTSGAGVSILNVNSFNKNNNILIKLRSLESNNDNILFGLELFSHYLSPVHLQKFFRYKIDNEEFSDWELWYSNKIVFAQDISGGKHNLTIEALSGFDYFQKTKAVFPFEITKPFYKSMTFRVILISISLLITFAFLLILRLKVITKAKRLVEEKNKEITESANLLENQKEIISNQNHSLRESLALRTKMISIISHDIKNPLSLLARNSEMIQDSSISLTKEELNQKLESNLSTINKIALLLDDMLQWARNQASGAASELKPVNFEFIISKIKKIFHNSIELKRLNFITDIDEKIELIVDENMLESILRNIISNAIKFTPENGIIQIRLSESEYYYIISILDSGVGMTETQLSNLFKINVLSTEGTFNEKGSGYGLVIAREFVGWLGGLLEVSSHLNLGTKFRIKLPKLLDYD
jgi:signal transduction histidine kinase/ligand-binding sensor domain-containing protein